MIVILVDIETDAASIDAIRGAVATMETASRAEPGCIDYTFSQPLSDPDRIRVNEIWESMDALREHFAMPHMATFRETLAAYPPKSMDAKVYELGQELELPAR